MRCPFCRTENRDERDSCYYCGKDLSMLRLILHKARTHFNNALEFAERDRNQEAIRELHNALDLDHSHINSHVVLGTLYLKEGEAEKAEQSWQEALNIDPRLEKAHNYLDTLERARANLPLVRRQRLIIVSLFVLLLIAALVLFQKLTPGPERERMRAAWTAYEDNDHRAALERLDQIAEAGASEEYLNHARLLRKLVVNREQNLYQDAQRALQMRDFLTANEILGELMAANPSETILIRARGLHERLMRLARDQVAQAVEQFSEGALSEEAVREQFKTYSLLLIRQLDGSAATEDEFLLRERESFEQLLRVNLAERARERFNSGEYDVWQYLTRLTELRERFPDAQSVTGPIEKHFTLQREKWTEAFERNYGEDQLLLADIALQNLERLYDIVAPAEKEQALAPLYERIQTRQATRQIRLAEQALDQDRPRVATLYLREALGLQYLPEETRAQALELLQRAEAANREADSPEAPQS